MTVRISVREARQIQVNYSHLGRLVVATGGLKPDDICPVHSAGGGAGIRGTTDRETRLREGYAGAALAAKQEELVALWSII